ncbi:hypothetical protein GCL60_15130 [Silvanigrella paludirubra]|uniref:Type II secretion system protein GspE N-terminal domain-containing protein n=1 Tax=Silvanigrella paludirubra TaxID=2499159 RepID=A0A6N6VQT8_9BACT|nr:hypothetical protein [Silvanigrella paludirubra]KAB8036461.1 hypothetical protein GCL60_15130 [Silvanigrella paludirubra]
MYDLLQVMQQDGYLSSGELIALRKTCKELGENPVRILRSLNIASPEQIQEYLQRYFRVNALSDKAISMLDESYQNYIPIDLAIHYSCFGLGEENSILYVALEDPSDRGAIQQLRFFLNKRIIGISATVFQLAEGLSKIYRVSIPNLKLTTVIERSRGVIGGLRYEAPFEAEAITIGEDFAGANLSDYDSDEVSSFVSNSEMGSSGKSEGHKGDDEPSPDISFPEMNSIAKAPDPSIGFIDGSSGEIAAGVLDVEDKPDIEGAGLSMSPPVAEIKEATAPSTEENPPSEALQSQENQTVEPAEANQENPEENLLSEEAPLEAAPQEGAELIEEAPLETAPQESAELSEEAPLETAPQESAELSEEAPLETAPQESAELSEEAQLETASTEGAELSEEAPLETAPQEGAELSEEAPLETASTEGAELSEEAPLETAPQEGAELSEEAPLETATSEETISEETIVNNNKEMNENQISQLSSLASSALIKISLINDKDKAIEIMNSILNSHNVNVTFDENNAYKITGEDFSSSGDLSSVMNQNENPISVALDPVLKRILKMNNSAS